MRNPECNRSGEDLPKLRILLTGTYAPPYGGMSVYVQRLFHHLIANGHRCRVLDSINPPFENDPPDVLRLRTRWAQYRALLAEASPDIVHINESRWKQRLMLIWISRLKGARSVLTLHSFRDRLPDSSPMNRWMIRTVLKSADVLISSGAKELDSVRLWIGDRPGMHALSPFMAPDLTDTRLLPEPVEHFLNRYEGRVVSANASNLDFYEGKDIYGLDLFVSLCERMGERHDLGFVFFLSKVTEEAYFSEILQRIDARGLTDRFLFVLEPLPFWKVIRRSAVFVRPTRTDSYGISVAEAVALGVPCVASDVCPRPEGAVLFPSDNLEALTRAVEAALSGGSTSTHRPEDGAAAVEGLYYQALEGR